jgi:hypothetical protein
LKKEDIRTVITEIENKEENNPCLPDGKSYQIELQVKQATWDPEAEKVVYSWETVKTINSDKSGKIMEVCAE